jgi:hypothetical protein
MSISYRDLTSHDAVGSFHRCLRSRPIAPGSPSRGCGRYVTPALRLRELQRLSMVIRDHKGIREDDATV